MTIDVALSLEVILDHARQRHGRVPDLGPVPSAPEVRETHQINPVCGDEVRLRVVLAEAGGVTIVRDLAWTGEGCSISQASVSVLHGVVAGAPLEKVRDAVAHFRTMIRSRGEFPGDETLIGDGVAFGGVGRHASRVKCAMLGWVALDQALYLSSHHDGGTPK